MKLDRELRLALEEIIDNHLKDPKASEASYSMILEAEGISSNFETIFAYIAGFIFGCAYTYYSAKCRRIITADEIIALSEWMKRRAIEIREAFAFTRKAS